MFLVVTYATIERSLYGLLLIPEMWKFSNEGWLYKGISGPVSNKYNYLILLQE